MKIAKRYVKALLESFNTNELIDLTDELKSLSQAFASSKFTTILSSPDISKKNKTDFVLSLLKNKDKRLVNFISLLGENKRLLLLKAIYEELEFQISLRNNRFNGKIYAGFDIDKKQIENLQKSFSEKFGAQINLDVHKSNYSGIKIQIDDIGVETSFSLDRLKAQMAEHILKAI
ncbi:MAG: F0F1 ATP synthase subunit delta [Campylobacteraceae bacterium]|jgi:F-type H+-transporting ATPase subunit delta|nr:F0F1 ATP synthase subunit delta [Campylobacteraceae bacterium]